MKKWKNILLITTLLFLIFVIMIVLPQFKKTSHGLHQLHNTSDSIFDKTGEKPPGGKLNAS
ncbi:MAG TPA: hypothetical protein VNC84_06615 [Gammaproteobacteria bacterium]|jgi:hypothetical protein|nr:hypothetical protein [Gammaproteobacteria bacterium]